MAKEKKEFEVLGKKVSSRMRIVTLIKLRDEVLEHLEVSGINNNQKKELKAQLKQINELIKEKENKPVKPKKVNIKDVSPVVTENEIKEVMSNQVFRDSEGSIVLPAVFGLAKMASEIRKSVISMPDKEIRYVVDGYYQVQKFRIGVENQVRALNQGKDGEKNDHTVMQYIYGDLKNLEEQIKVALETYSDSNKVTQWAKSVMGIGPVLSSSLFAYLDVTGVNHAGNFWSYAGLNSNNNPWLGVEKSTAIVNELFKIRAIKNKAFKKAFNNIPFEKNIAASLHYDESKVKDYIETLLSSRVLTSKLSEAYELCHNELISFEQINDKYMPLDGEELEEELLTAEEVAFKVAEGKVPDPTLGHININIPFTIDDIVDYLFSLSDNNVVSSVVMNMLVQKLNGRRKYVNMVRSATDYKDDSRYFNLISKTSLIKYLSKPPYNTKLKTLMWKIGDSFRKVCNNPKSLYGKLYKERKAEESLKNSQYEYYKQAALILKSKNFNKNTEAYKWYSQGMLPPGHIEQRAMRYAVKIFIDHLFEAMYIDAHGVMPENPYPINRLGHVDYIAPEVAYNIYWTYEERK